MVRTKVDRWRHRAELVNQGATLVLDVFRCFCPALVNDCTMHDAFHLECCHQTRKLLTCVPKKCFILSGSGLSLWLTMTYRQSIMSCKVERESGGLDACLNCSCWHIELSEKGPSPPWKSAFIWAIAVYSCSMKSFPLKITLGLALRESWPCLRNHRIWVSCLPLPVSVGELF